MPFLVGEKLLEQLHRHVVAEFLADLAGLLVRGPGLMLAGKVGFENFLDILADAQRRDGLKVGMAFQKDDPLDELVGVVHFLDRLGAFLLGQLRIAPVVEKPVVQPVLVDRSEFEKQRLVKPLDDPFFAFHECLSRIDRATRGRGRDMKHVPCRRYRGGDGNLRSPE